MKQWMTRNSFALITAAALFLFTSYALLDTFVIPHAYQTAEGTATRKAAQKNTGNQAKDGTEQDNPDSDTPSEPVITENSYKDSAISVTITEYRVNDTDIYVADVQLAAPEYLKTAFAKNTYGKNVKETTSAIAKEVDAILAINGDFYGSRTGGYVIRNGVLYRDKASSNEALAIYADGSMEVVKESQVSAKQLLSDGAVQVLSFGPGLIEDGGICVSTRQEVGRAMASNPRTAIGWYSDTHYVFVVADGRTGENDGLSLYELAQFLQTLGVKTAYNLDGGGSSTMVFLGEVVNHPTTNGRSESERSVSDIVYIGY
ncbi:MAG: phosphodiester glycosidase family protein [Lachnospiraceae bacterium]|nr:phosphodiester glycosidase family protein [Lachnospiraceae bacterium]